MIKRTQINCKEICVPIWDWKAYKYDMMSVAIVSVLCYHLYQIPTNNDTRYKFLKWSEIVRGSIYIGIDIFHGPGAELDPVP